jgi:heme-degrading monooxygenase HmoA
MGDYYSVRIWRLKAGHTGAELEALASSGYLEMQRWIPGVKHISLVRSGADEGGHYVLTTTFVNQEAYSYWRQVEEEAPDYWERYAAILMQWECICQLVGGYAGEKVLDVYLDESITSQ